MVVVGALCLWLVQSSHALGQDPEKEAISMITQIYSEVSGKGESSVDWNKVRSFFDPAAVIVLRTSKEASSQFTVDEFIQDFKRFYNSPTLGESGFKERVLQVESQVYFDMAFIAVVYEAIIVDSERPPQKGIDYWLLSRNKQNWKVVAVTNEIVPADGLLPEIFEQ